MKLKSFIVKVRVILAAIVLAASSFISADAAEKVLILSTTVYQGVENPPGSGIFISLEEEAARDLGYDVDVKTPTEWADMDHPEQFATYRAIILGDNLCDFTDFSAAEGTVGIWGETINGNVIIIGTDPVFHYSVADVDGARTLIRNGIAFAVAQPGKTGFYVSLSCGEWAPGITPPVLSPFGDFSTVHYDCGSPVHKVASHPVLDNITDAHLSGWGCSVHQGFTEWPADFSVLAMAVTPSVKVTGAGVSSVNGIYVQFALTGNHHDTYFSASGHVIVFGSGIWTIYDAEGTTALYSTATDDVTGTYVVVDGTAPAATVGWMHRHVKVSGAGVSSVNGIYVGTAYGDDYDGSGHDIRFESGIWTIYDTDGTTALYSTATDDITGTYSVVNGTAPAATVVGLYTATDGTKGVPYIFARGQGLRQTTGYTSLAIDKDDNVWISGPGLHQKVVVSGASATVTIPAYATLAPVAGGLGNAIDWQGRIWSAKGNEGLVRFNDNPANRNRINFAAADFGDFNLGLDPVTGNIWTARNGEPVFNIGSGESVLKYQYSVPSLFTFPDVVGLAADKSGNLWLANPDGINRVTHLRTDGTLLGWVSLSCLQSLAAAGPRGIAVDGNGKVWTPDSTSGKLFRIDPNAGPIVYEGLSPAGGTFAQRLGAVDLTVDLGVDAFPDNYTDMAGLVTSTLRNPSGTWSTVRDGGVTRTWTRIGWTQVLPANTAIDVKVRATASVAGLASQAFVTVPTGGGTDSAGVLIPGGGVVGQFIQIQVTLSRLPGATVGSTPTLKDLRITSAASLPALPPDDFAQLAQADAYTTYRNSAEIILDVMKNDALKTFSPDATQISKVTSAKSGTVRIGAGGADLRYQPNLDFSGTDNFTYTVTDGQGAIGQAIVEVQVVRIDPALSPPVAVNDAVPVSGNSVRTFIDVLANDCAVTGLNPTECADRRGEIKLIGVGQPGHGVTAIVDCNQIEYTPSAYFVGTDQFTYRISNGSAEPRSATVTVTVTGDSPITIGCGDSPMSGSLATTDMNSLGRPGYYSDTYYLNVTAGKAVAVTLNSSAFHPLLTVKSPRGGLIQSRSTAPGTPANITFTPREPALYIVEVSSADGQTPKVGSYNLSWTCQQIWVKSGAIGLPNEGELDFGITTLGSTVHLPLTIGNDGASVITISGFGSETADYKVSLNQGDTPIIGPLAYFTVPAGDVRTVFVHYTPTTAGDHSGRLNFIPIELVEEFSLYLKGHANQSGTPPTVAIQTPANDASYVAPVTVRILATASAAGVATLQPVQFYARRADQNSFALIGTVSTPPFALDWNGGTPAGLDVGDYQIAVVATDNNGRAAVASTVIHVGVVAGPNDEPSAFDDVRSFVVDSANNSISVLANDTDPENDTLLITGSAQPLNGKITLSGNTFSYTPNAGYVGADSFPYIITDQKGGYSKAFVKIDVVDPFVPNVQIQSPSDGYSATLPLVGGVAVTAQATAVSPAQVSKVQFYVDGQLIGEDTTAASGNLYSLVWSTLRPGSHTLTAVVTDTKGRTRRSNPSQIRLNPDPNNVPPIAVIATVSAMPVPTPTDFAGLERPAIIRTPDLAVTGTARDGTSGQTVTYQLLVYDSEKRIVAKTVPVTDAGVTSGSLGTVSLAGLARGSYDLELVVNDASDERRDSVSFIYESDLQVGQFKFSMEDLAIPVHGVNLSIFRSYDSLNTRLGDFGYSWTYSLLDMQMEINEFREDRIGDQGERFNVRAGGGWDITLTLPDGKRTTYYFEPGAFTGVPDYAYKNPKWTAGPGVTAKLEPLTPLTIQASERAALGLNGGTFYWTPGSSRTPLERFDIPDFKLTMEDGTQYFFERELMGTWFPDVIESDELGEDPSGENLGIDVDVRGKPKLTRVILPTHDEIRVSGEQTDSQGRVEFKVEHFVPVTGSPNGGITTSAILFRRNSQGVVSEVFGPDSLAPDGSVVPTLQYKYDTHTNLTEVLSLVDKQTFKYEKTTFLYEKSAFPHFITKILDARNIPAARTEYYSNPADAANYGKIKSVTDVRGRVTEFEHITNPAQFEGGGVYGTPLIREEIKFTPLPGTPLLFTLTVHEADARGNVIYSKDASDFEIWRKYEPPAGNADASVQTEERYVVGGVTYVRQWEYGNTTGSDAKKMSPTTVTDLYDLDNTPLNMRRITRFVYNDRGEVLKTYKPKYSSTFNDGNASNDVYDETTYVDDTASPAYRQVREQYFRGTDPASQKLSENFYYEAQNSPFKGQLWYSTDAQGVVTVLNYHDGTVPTEGRVGDLQSVVTYPAGTPPANFGSTPYLSKSSYTYDKSGNRLTETSWYTGATGEESITTSHTYDSKGRPTKTIDATLATSETTYNSIGRATTTDRYNATTASFFDRAGAISSTRYPDGTVTYQATYYEAGGSLGVLKCHVVEDRHFPFATGEKATGTRTVQDKMGRTIRSERVRNLVIKVAVSGDSEVYDTEYDTANPCQPLTGTLTFYYADGRVWKTVQDHNGNGTVDSGEPLTEFQYASDGLRKTTILPDAPGVTQTDPSSLYWYCVAVEFAPPAQVAQPARVVGSGVGTVAEEGTSVTTHDNWPASL